VVGTGDLREVKEVSSITESGSEASRSSGACDLPDSDLMTFV